MDLSKLPRLSKTDAPPAPDPADAVAAPPGARGFDPVMTSSAPAAGFCRCGAPARAGARFCESCGAPLANTGLSPALPYGGAPEPGVGAEVWISVAIGALLLLMQPRLLQFLSHMAFGTFFAPYIDSQTGAEVRYTAQLDFWSDLGITLFAFVLIIEGLALSFARRRGVVMMALGLTVITTAYNLGYLVLTFSSGIAILSAFAVAFGVYIAIFEWRMLQSTRAQYQQNKHPGFG
jgi:hypothetical protein